MKHIRTFESEENLSNMLDDLDALSGRGKLTRRLYGWFVVWTSGDEIDFQDSYGIIKAESEEQAVKSIWEGFFNIDTEDEVPPPKTFDDFGDAFYDMFGGMGSDYTSPNLRWFEMTPRNRSLDNAGGYEIGQSPYDVVAALDKEFTDAKAVLAKEMK